MAEDQVGEAPYKRSVAASGLSRRRLFTALFGGVGLSSCSPSDFQADQGASMLALRLSPPGSVDLNGTAEQAIDIPHHSSAKPAAAAVVMVDAVQDDPSIDTHALRWAPGYPVYDEAGSTDTTARVLIKFAVPVSVPAPGRARILFDLSADPPGSGLSRFPMKLVYVG